MHCRSTYEEKRPRNGTKLKNDKNAAEKKTVKPIGRGKRTGRAVLDNPSIEVEGLGIPPCTVLMKINGMADACMLLNFFFVFPNQNTVKYSAERLGDPHTTRLIGIRIRKSSCSADGAC